MIETYTSKQSANNTSTIVLRCEGFDMTSSILRLVTGNVVFLCNLIAKFMTKSVGLLL